MGHLFSELFFSTPSDEDSDFFFMVFMFSLNKTMQFLYGKIKNMYV